MNKNTLLGLAAAACLMTITAVPVFADGADAPSVTCKDGTTSTTTGKGACSHHGGVNKSAPAAAAAATPAPAAAPAPAAKAASPAPAATKPASSKAAAPAATTTATAAGAPAGSTAKCKDGTYSKSKTRSGTCSRHGGVDTWLTS